MQHDILKEKDMMTTGFGQCLAAVLVSQRSLLSHVMTECGVQFVLEA